jgi:hypothetical protein
MASVDPPAAKGATMVIGRFGQSWAFAGTAEMKLPVIAEADAKARAVRTRRVFIDPLYLMLSTQPAVDREVAAVLPIIFRRECRARVDVLQREYRTCIKLPSKIRF